MTTPIPSRCSVLMRGLAAACLISFTMTFPDEDSPAAPADANYDEAKIPKYTLPDPLIEEDGSPVTTPEDWPERRAEILALFEEHVYGKTPEAKLPGLHFEARKEVPGFLDGKAVLKEVRVYFTEKNERPYMDLMLVLPADAKGPVPAFLLLNFSGNHSIHPSPEITLPDAWMRETSKTGDLVKDHRAQEAARGFKASRFPLETIVSRGYGLVTAYYGDIDPDFDDGFQNGVHPLFYAEDQKAPKPDEWGSIGAWAWGLSRALDYLETDAAVDAEKVAVLGHSRLGKTSLWAGAQDERFAVVISNDSGCGGAALSRRRIGETVGRINENFPHWFCDNFNQYSGNEDALPVDQHELIALVAPRPVYVASAVGDEWADPKGEFLSAKLAEPVYKLLGKPGLGEGVEGQPPVDHPVGETIGYHIRTGEHDLTLYDWERYLDFADRHLGKGE